MGLQTHPEVVPSRNGLQVCIKTQPFVTLCPTCWLLQCWSRLSCLRDCLAIWLLHTVKWLPAGHTNAGLTFTHSQVATCRPHQRWSRLYSQSSGHKQATPTLVSPLLTVKWPHAGHTNAGLTFTHSQVATCRPHQRWSRLLTAPVTTSHQVQ